MDYSQLKYRNKISKKVQVARLAWGIVWSLIFRTTPRWCLHGWRCALLRAFGAKIGKGCKIDPSCRIWAPWNIELGDYTALAEGVDCYSVDRIRIGSKVAVSQRSFLCTASHDITSLLRPLVHAPIQIEDHAWICGQVFMGPGVHLGEGAVVAAGSVVTKDVAEWTVVGGNPAKFIKNRRLRDEEALK